MNALLICSPSCWIFKNPKRPESGFRFCVLSAFLRLKCIMWLYSLINSVNDSLTVTNTKLNPHKAQLSFDVSSVKVLFECANIFYKSLNMLLRRKEIASGGAGVERARATGSAVARVFNRPLSLINKKQLSKTLKISRTHPRSVQRELHLSNCSSSSVNPRVRLARA